MAGYVGDPALSGAAVASLNTAAYGRPRLRSEGSATALRIRSIALTNPRRRADTANSEPCKIASLFGEESGAPVKLVLNAVMSPQAE